jgi:hypothetical protein
VKTLGKATCAPDFASPCGDGLATVVAIDFSRSASVALPGSRGRTSSAGGLQPAGVPTSTAVEAVRGCSPSTTHRITTKERAT